MSANKVIARLPNPIASPEPKRRQRNLAFTNPSVAIHEERAKYFVRGWGTTGKQLSGIDGIGEWRLERPEGKSGIFKARAKENDPFSLEEITEKPIIKARPNHSIIDKEDPRITFLEEWGIYAITVTETRMVRNKKQEPSLTFSPVIYVTTDFERYTRRRGSPKTGLWLLTKDWVLFPKKVYDPFGQKAFSALFSTRVGKKDEDPLLRRYYREKPGIWIAYSNDLVHWYGHKEILKPNINEAKLGPSSQPIDIGNHWLAFIHAVKMEQYLGTGIRFITQDQIDTMPEKEKETTERVYTPQAVLLDKRRPDTVYYVTDDLTQPEGWEISPEYRLRHHMITSAMKAILLDGQSVSKYITWHGAGDKHFGASIIDPKSLQEAMHQVPKERTPIPKP